MMAPPLRQVMRRVGVMVAAALLYVGAFALGMAGRGVVGWSGVLTLLLGWTVIMKPAAQWSGPGLPGAMRAGATLVVLGILAAGIWALGQGAALFIAPPPLWVGWALGIAGIALGRAVWNPSREAELDAFVTEATAELQSLAEAMERATIEAQQPEPQPSDSAPLAELEAALDELATAGSPPWESIDPLIAQAVATVKPLELSLALFRRARSADAHTTERAALVAAITRPEVARAALGQEDLAEGFFLLAEAEDLDSMAHLVARTGTLLAEFPDAWRDLPGPDWLESWASAAQDAGWPELGDGLQALALYVHESLYHDD